MRRIAVVLSPLLLCRHSANGQISPQSRSTDALVKPLLCLILIPLLLSNVLGQTVSATGTRGLTSSSATQAATLLAAAQAKLNPAGVLPPLKITGQITKTEPPGISQLTLYIANSSHYRSEVVTNGSLFLYVVNEWKGWYDDNGKRRGLPLHMTYGQRCPLLPAYTLLADQNSPNFRTKQLSKRGKSDVVDVAFAHDFDPDFDTITRTSLVFDPTTGLLSELDSLLLAVQLLDYQPDQVFLFELRPRTRPRAAPHNNDPARWRQPVNCDPKHV